jgi:putative sterol carrier protein
MIKRAKTARDWFETADQRFDPNGAEGIECVFQWEITGDRDDNRGNWFQEIKDGKCKTVEGYHESPTVTIKISGNDYLRLYRGELKGPTAFITGKMKMSGKIMNAVKLPQIFPCKLEKLA